MKTIGVEEYLNFVAFVFTIYLTLYGLYTGYDITELSITLLYLFTICITLLLNILRHWKR